MCMYITINYILLYTLFFKTGFTSAHRAYTWSGVCLFTTTDSPGDFNRARYYGLIIQRHYSAGR